MLKKHFHYQELIDYAFKLLEGAGLEQEKAIVVAQTLIEADLMGHTTHGIRLLPSYLTELEKGAMTALGDVIGVSDHGSAITWDGNFLPGPWLVHKAIDFALTRIRSFPVITMVIRKSHHLACLATYPGKVTQQGLIMLLTCTDPNNKTVAPFGGSTAVLGSNPIAAGFPTSSMPVIFDISTSETAGGQVQKSYEEGGKLVSSSILVPDGSTTDDPAVFVNDPSASILPLGGIAYGYKGTALGILSEALTNGLGAYGRKDFPERWCASVFMQIINPEAFGGRDGFVQEMDVLTSSCKGSATLPGTNEVRLPGERAMGLKDIQMRNGLAYHAGLIDVVKAELEKYTIPFPISF